MKRLFKALKFIGFLLFVAVAIIACDQDFNSIDSDVIGQKSFNVDKSLIPIISYNKKLDSVKINNLAASLFGVFNDPIYGQTTANIVTQITPITFDPNFGDNPVIDSVILTIPYFSRITGTDGDSSIYTIKDSLFGNDSIKLTIFQNKYFLRDFNPNAELGVLQNYYSNANSSINNGDSFAITEEGTINFDDHKSVEAIYPSKSFLPSGDAIELKKLNKDGTKTTEKIAPALRLKLTTDFWKTTILDKEGSSELSNPNNFYNYFRGLYFKAEAINGTGNMILLNLTNAGSNITIYYSHDSTTNPDEKLQETYVFNFNGTKLNTFRNNLTIPLENGDSVNGDEKLYLKGNGSMAVVDLFTGLVDCDGTQETALECFKDTYRAIDEETGDYITKNGKFVLKRLINEAQLVIYEDEIMQTLPKDANDNDYSHFQRIYAYDIKNNTPLIDYNLDPTSNASDAYNSVFSHLGQRKKDENGVAKYKIRITELLNNILLRDSTNTKIGLVLSTNVNYTSNSVILNREEIVTEVPSASIITPKGTILYGSNENVPENRRMSLEIYFTEPKEN